MFDLQIKVQITTKYSPFSYLAEKPDIGLISQRRFGGVPVYISFTLNRIFSFLEVPDNREDIVAREVPSQGLKLQENI